MSNRIEIFINQATDGESQPFSISPRDSIGVNDTEHSAYFEIFGGIGGGELLLKKKCQDETFRELVTASAKINEKIAALDNADKSDIIAINLKSDDQMKMELTGAAGATFNVTGINMKFNESS